MDDDFNDFLKCVGVAPAASSKVGSSGVRAERASVSSGASHQAQGVRWTCPACDEPNNATRKACNNCGHPRPAATDPPKVGSSGVRAERAREKRSRSRSQRAGAGPAKAVGTGGKDPIAKHVCHLEVPHFRETIGELLGPARRYQVKRLLGEGTFGRVLSCIDMEKKEAVAVKVVKSVKRYCDFAEAEAEVLKEILRCDPAQQSRVVRLRETFMHPPMHYCLVFERLGVSLHDYMQKEGSKGLLVADVRSIAQQLLQCLCFIHGMQLTHTDLKCRNIMLYDPRFDLVPLPRAGDDVQTRKCHSNRIAVIDFGGALFEKEKDNGKIGTRHYRSPEVVIGLPWDEKVDLWSVGCVVALTYLGYRPILASEDFEQLAVMERFLGKEFPRPMAKAALSSGGVQGGTMFNKSGRLEWPKRAPDQEAVARVEQVQPMQQLISSKHGVVLELLEGLMRFDPKQRLSAEAASDLPFIAGDTAVPE